MIYLDNNATTPLAESALSRMMEAAREATGNPGSRHAAGRRARQWLEDAREQIASILDAQPTEVLFTSGGTESSNLAIHGLTAGRIGELWFAEGEHPSLAEPARRLLQLGWSRHSIPLTSSGLYDLPAAQDSGEFSTHGLICAQLAHNETGVIRDVTAIRHLCDARRWAWHLDAVQAVGKIPVSFKQLGCTTLSAAAHKFHGPVGIGLLLVRHGVKLTPASLGGHQERETRPGTEAVMLAVGMAEALRTWHSEQQESTSHLTALRDHLQAGLQQTCAPVVVNGLGAPRLPNTLHIAFPGCAADGLLVSLDLVGVCCSLGSACASGSTEPAPVLLAMGLPLEIAQSSLRLSLGRQNTFEEIEHAVRLIATVVQRLRRAENPTSA